MTITKKEIACVVACGAAVLAFVPGNSLASENDLMATAPVHKKALHPNAASLNIGTDGAGSTLDVGYVRVFTPNISAAAHVNYSFGLAQMKISANSTWVGKAKYNLRPMVKAGVNVGIDTSFDYEGGLMLDMGEQLNVWLTLNDLLSSQKRSYKVGANYVVAQDWVVTLETDLSDHGSTASLGAQYSF
jgi:hypothetical protein